MRVSGLTVALFVAGSIATLTQTQPGQPAPGVPAAPGQLRLRAQLRAQVIPPARQSCADR